MWAPPGTADAPTHGSGPPGRDPRIGRSSRTGTLLAGLALVATAAAVAPVLAAIGWLAWATVARVADRTLTGLTLKRIERGARSSDVPLTVLAVPVHLLTSILSTLVSAVLPVIVGAATAVTAAYLESALGQQTMAVDRPLPMAVGAVVGVGLSWWGVGGTSLRRGSRSLVRGLSPGRGGAAVASTLLLLGAAYLALRTQASGSQVVWWPLQGSPRRWVGW